jgi:very-short-patch-repair endonuclease
MSRTLPTACIDLAERQRGVISRRQALANGLPADVIDRLLRNARWQRLHRGVYSIYTGEPPREAVLWAALLRVGCDAVLSHQSAAEALGLTDRPSSLIHVSIPASRRVERIPEMVIHRSTRLRDARHPSLQPPCTRIEETVLDLAAQTAKFDTAFSAACAACQRRLTTADLLLSAMNSRKKLRWRAELTDALIDIGDGVHSLLEYRYARRVERPHQLPKAIRQARIVRGTRTWYLDNLYSDYGLCVELDGQEAHPEDRRWQDIRRDNAAATLGLTTLRYSWADVTRRPCQTAAQLAAVLRNGGWTGSPAPCGPTCPIGPRAGAG